MTVNIVISNYMINLLHVIVIVTWRQIK